MLRRELVFWFDASFRFILSGVKVQFFPPVAIHTSESSRAVVLVVLDVLAFFPIGAKLMKLSVEVGPFEVLPVVGVNAGETVVPLPREGTKLALELEEHEVPIDREQVKGTDLELTLAVSIRTHVPELASVQAKQFPTKLLFIECGMVLLLDYIVRELAVLFQAITLAPSSCIPKFLPRSSDIFVGMIVDTGTAAFAEWFSRTASRGLVVLEVEEH